MTKEVWPPPWQKYPTIPIGSLGWRMGHGEEYWYAWQDWYAGLATDQRHRYQKQYPEPSGWEGFYVRTIESLKNRIR